MQLQNKAQAHRMYIQTLKPDFVANNISIFSGDCLYVLDQLPANSVDSIITDPPYNLGFMGAKWDKTGVAFSPDTWAKCLRVAKPGAFILVFGGSRTFHRITCAIEDAGWEIKDCFSWLYSQGMPKGTDISKAIDREAGAERKIIGKKKNTYDNCVRDPSKHGNPADQSNIGKWGLKQSPHGLPETAPATLDAKLWSGWGTTLKPAWEPIIVAMKPLDGTFVDNAKKHGVAGLNIAECRIDYRDDADKSSATPQGKCTSKEISAIGAEPDVGRNLERVEFDRPPLDGRWPSNVLLTHHDECTDESCFHECAILLLNQQTGVLKSGSGPCIKKSDNRNVYGKDHRYGLQMRVYGDTGGSSRFFYCGKVSKSERNLGLPPGMQNKHPTIKPLKLMEYLCNLTKTPTGGVVLDPFMGSGTTGMAAKMSGRSFIGIELEKDFFEIAKQRVQYAEKLKHTERDIFDDRI